MKCKDKLSLNSAKINGVPPQPSENPLQNTNAWWVCVYCRDISDSRDHVIPRSASDQLGQDFSHHLVVPCCRNCNSVLGNRGGSEIRDRAWFLLRRLQEKHARLLLVPDWTKEALSEMGGKLRRKISADLRKRDRLKSRLDWLAVTSKLDLTVNDAWVLCKPKKVSTEEAVLK